jgi:acyl transferase domain-containing protein/thioesterase domain-containing protein
MNHSSPSQSTTGTEIAVIGMAGRFPGAAALSQFWRNLREGVESVKFFTGDELTAAGELPENLENPAYVRACPYLDAIDQFDAGFFGFSPRDAAIMDPQHRLFLEVAWAALEDAGYNPETHGDSIGVFGASGMNLYMMYNLLSNPDLMDSMGEFLVRHAGNDKDFLATRVSYEMNLKGPSVNVQTACSSSLVAIHLAMQSLLNGECDMAMAGGVTILLPHQRGYVFKEGEILSPDGHCRAFDAESKGTIFGSGVGIVVLKRLEDALNDRDNILAVIKGSAINNDGAMKVGYLAPSVEGQAKAISEAITLSGVDPATISYLEAHGTGTLVGDPIEITALTQAYRKFTDKTGYCAIGSLKTNIGHLGETAGVAGFIKTVLALKHGVIPPSLNYSKPNPQAGFETSPFFVITQATEWKSHQHPRRAGVTALGAGGTNAHVILEEAPPLEPGSESRPWQMLLLSAKSPLALDAASLNLASHLRKHPELNLADVAYTLAVGRKGFEHRRLLVCKDREDAIAVLESKDSKRLLTQTRPKNKPTVVFMFPGGGAQYATMGRELYDTEPVYFDAINECLDFISPKLGVDLKGLMFPEPADVAVATKELEKPSLALPTLFATEYALAKLLMSWGVEPAAMIGHSMGEYVAACLAGVFSCQDGLALVALRGRLFETLPEGGMLSVPLPESEARKFMGSDLSFAAINGPSLSVISGPVASIAAAEAAMGEKEIECTRIHINVAAHSQMLEPILAEFELFCRTIRFRAPARPYISNLTGTWITEAEVTDPRYWVKHLRNTVRFADGLAELLKDPSRVLLEIGPGRTLSSLAKQQPGKVLASLSTLRHPKEESSDLAFLLTTYGRLWLCGLPMVWPEFFAEEHRRRVPLPSYPFEHQRYWVEPGRSGAVKRKGKLRKLSDLADWFCLPTWKRSVLLQEAARQASGSWLVFLDSNGLGQQFVRRLKGAQVVTVIAGNRFLKKSDGAFVINPAERGDYDKLILELTDRGWWPDQIVHFWSVTDKGPSKKPMVRLDSALVLNFYSLFYLAQALATEERPSRITVISNGSQQIAGEGWLQAEKALVIGPVRVIPREFPQIGSRSVDVAWPTGGDEATESLCERLFWECLADTPDPIVALRGSDRWVQALDPLRIGQSTGPTTHLRRKGVYLITGGLGGIGFELAKHLVKSCDAKLVLMGRTQIPSKDLYASWLAQHPEHDPVSQAIHKLEFLGSLGADVLVASADVTDLVQVKRVVEQARRRFGTLHGVIHTAGVLRDSLIQLKTKAEADEVLLAKTKGALALDYALKDQPLDFFVLCSSVSSILGLPGQVDYTAANAFLDAFARERTARTGSRTIAVNWSAWQQVGMVSAIGDRTASLGSFAPSGTSRPVRSPLWETCVETADHRLVFQARFSLNQHWLLSEHVVKGGDALIPGTGFLELVRAAWQNLETPDSIEIYDVVFLAPFVVKVGSSRLLRLTFHQTGAATEFKLDSPASAEIHVSGKVRSVVKTPLPTHAISILKSRCHNRSEVLNGFLNQRFMNFGARWGCIKRIDYGESEAFITLVLPEPFVRELGDFRLHPALLDMATGGAQPLISGFDPETDFFVPFSYGRIVLHQALPPTLLSHVRYRDRGKADMAVFDITLMDESGNEVATITDFMMRRVQADRLLTESAPIQETNFTTSASAKLLNAVLREGILPEEGMELFDRILSQTGLSQIIASSVDIHLWQAQVELMAKPFEESSSADNGSGPKFSRPSLQTDFAAPSNEEERFLAEVWQELLGVERVGTHDDFFELGGQSLIAVRLFNRIKKHYKLEFGLAVLFEAPTIAACAAMIRERLGLPKQEETAALAKGEDNHEVTSPTSGVTAPRKSLCIVPIRAGGKRPPLFVIHGMGGNIVEYMHLAKYLHSDQPLYGIQAQGLDGKKPILTRVDEIASTYIEECRAFQPEGPYYLGGSSFGGLVGYAMAQKLLREGQRVAMLALFDSYGKDYPKPLPATRSIQHLLNRQRYRFDLHYTNLRLLPADERLNYILEKLGVFRRHARRFTQDASAKFRRRIQLMLLPKALREQALLTGEDVQAMQGIEVPKIIQEIQSASSNAARTYALTPYSGKVVLFRATHQPPGIYEDRTNGWGQIVQDLEIFDVPGHHGAIVREPRVKVLAELLETCLVRIQTEESRRGTSASDNHSMPAAPTAWPAGSN